MWRCDKTCPRLTIEVESVAEIDALVVVGSEVEVEARIKDRSDLVLVVNIVAATMSAAAFRDVVNKSLAGKHPQNPDSTEGEEALRQGQCRKGTARPRMEVYPRSVRSQGR